MKDKTIIKMLDLENNLCVKIYDGSKKLIGDRYQVIMDIEIEIPITHSVLENDHQLLSDIKNLKSLLGDKVMFKKTRDKIFVDEKEKDNLLNTMIDSFVKDIIPYLSRPDFPVKFINKKYQEKLKKQNRMRPE
jgi:hypothetical protein